MNYRLLTLDEVEAALKPYGCQFVRAEFAGYEVWATGWGFHFTLSREPDLRHYDEWMVEQVIRHTIAATMPSDWTT